MVRYNILSNMSLRCNLGSFLGLLVTLSLVMEVRLHSLPKEAPLDKTQHSILMIDEHLDTTSHLNNTSTAVSSPLTKKQPAEVRDGSSILKKLNSEGNDEWNEYKVLKVLKSQDQPKRKEQAKSLEKTVHKNNTKINMDNTTEGNNRTTYSTSVTTITPTTKLTNLISSKSKELLKSNTSIPINEKVMSREVDKHTTVLDTKTSPSRINKVTQLDKFTTTTIKLQALSSDITTASTLTTKPVIPSIFTTNETSSMNKTSTTVFRSASTTSTESSTTSAATVRIAATTVTTLASRMSEQTTTTDVARKPEVVLSKRGGFLDNSIMNNDDVVNKTSTEKNQNTPVDNSNYGSLFGMIDTPTNDKRNIYAVSQSEMIEEALLAERMMFETEFMGHKKHKTKSNSDEQVQVKLNKNNSLYAVNPNYKPLKKLEVTMPKPYHKHPDDNSWRNESISQTLGIVFNPKNSSKPLTEVLKNMTDNELSILEKENINMDTPDLRERLEKLTEMRKAKKSKSENSSFEDERVSGTWHSGMFENYEDTLSTPKVDNLSPLSRNQQKLLDYDEHEEESDADYFSLANIEIKKRKQDSTGDRKGSKLSNADYAVSTGQFPAERKPSVQYFPPRATSDRAVKSREQQDYRFTTNSIEKTTTSMPKSSIDIQESDINYYDAPSKTKLLNRYNVMKEAYEVYKNDRLEVPYAKDLMGDEEDSEFPVVYKSKVLHEAPEREPRLLASSGASMRQLYLHEARPDTTDDHDQPTQDYSMHYYLEQDEINDHSLEISIPF